MQTLAAEPSVELRKARPYVSIPIRVTLKEWGKANALVPEVFAWVKEHGVEIAGAPFYRYWEIGSEDEEFRLEVGLPVSVPVEGKGRVQAGNIPAGRYATFVHQGHPDRLDEVHNGMQNSLRRQGLQPALKDGSDRIVWSARFERFLTDPAIEPDPNQWSVEVAYLLADRPGDVSP